MAALTRVWLTKTSYVVRRPGVLARPKPLVEFPWGSVSTKRTLTSFAASDAARFMAVVVFPTPPFWLVIAIVVVTRYPGRVLLVIESGWSGSQLVQKLVIAGSFILQLRYYFMRKMGLFVSRETKEVPVSRETTYSPVSAGLVSRETERVIYISNIATAAGVTPGIRAA